MKYAIAYLAAAFSFLLIDLLWLGLVAKTFYRDQLGPLMADTINWSAGLGFYALYVAGIVIFAVSPALAAGSWKVAVVSGALFGLFCYATYDLTNLATIKDWPAAMTFVDIGWGVIVTALTALVSFFVTHAIVGNTG